MTKPNPDLSHRVEACVGDLWNALDYLRVLYRSACYQEGLTPPHLSPAESQGGSEILVAHVIKLLSGIAEQMGEISSDLKWGTELDTLKVTPPDITLDPTTWQPQEQAQKNTKSDNLSDLTGEPS